jgi:hypothetical protein
MVRRLHYIDRLVLNTSISTRLCQHT